MWDRNSLRNNCGFSLVTVMVATAIASAAVFTSIFLSAKSAELARRARLSGLVFHVASDVAETLLMATSGTGLVDEGTHTAYYDLHGRASTDSASPILVTWVVAPNKAMDAVSEINLTVSWQSSGIQDNESATLKLYRLRTFSSANNSVPTIQLPNAPPPGQSWPLSGAPPWYSPPGPPPPATPPPSTPPAPPPPPTGPNTI